MILCKVFSILLNILYLPYRLLRVKNRVSLISRESDEMSIDFLYIKQELNRQTPETQVTVLCKKLNRNMKSAVMYFGHMFRQMKAIATSKIVICDTYCIAVSLLPHKKETTVIQIWHSSAAVKMFGYQSIGKPSGSSRAIAEAMKMHRNYDVLVAPSRATAAYFSKGFNYPQSRFLIAGLPRIDFIRNTEENPEIKKVYPKLTERENILYAPTFRKGKSIELSELIKNFDFKKYNLIVKLHPLDREGLILTEDERNRIILDEKFPTFEWVKIARKIISDYSAIGVESALIDKEVYYYVYDIQEYRRTTGLNMDFSKEAISAYVFEDAKDLSAALDEPYDYSALREFREKYFEVDEINCSKTFVEEIRRFL